MRLAVRWYERAVAGALRESVSERAARLVHINRTFVGRGRLLPPALSAVISRGALYKGSHGVPFGARAVNYADHLATDDRTSSGLPWRGLWSLSSSGLPATGKSTAPGEKKAYSDLSRGLVGSSPLRHQGSGSLALQRPVDKLGSTSVTPALASMGIPVGRTSVASLVRGAAASSRVAPASRTAGGLAGFSTVAADRRRGLGALVARQRVTPLGRQNPVARMAAAPEVVSSSGPGLAWSSPLTKVDERTIKALPHSPGLPSLSPSMFHVAVSEPLHDGLIQDQGDGFIDVVPRRPLEEGRPSMVAQQNDLRRLGTAAVATTHRRYSAAGVSSSGHPENRSLGKPSVDGASPATITLRGNILMDGRRVGRLITAGQSTAANLPQVSSSAVNLRATPVFAGTSLPL